MVLVDMVLNQERPWPSPSRSVVVVDRERKLAWKGRLLLRIGSEVVSNKVDKPVGVVENFYGIL